MSSPKIVPGGEVEIIASYQTAFNVKLTIVAEGPWSAVDIERLHTLIDKGLRIGAFDAKQPEPPK